MTQIIRTEREVFKSSLLTLVGPDDEIAEDEYGASVEMEIPPDEPDVSGEIVAISLYSSGLTNLDSVGNVMFFDADPEITLGDTVLTPAQRRKQLASVAVALTDWQLDASTGHAGELLDCPIPFGPTESLFVDWDHQDAAALNDEAADNEALEAYVHYHKTRALA